MENTTALTPMQSAFAVALVENGGNASAAARDAGYAETSARVLAHRLLKHEGVQRMVRDEQWRLVNGSLASASLNVLRQALDMSNQSVPWSARIEAAKTLLDRGGLVLNEQPGRQSPFNAAQTDLSGLLARLIEAKALRDTRLLPEAINAGA